MNQMTTEYQLAHELTIRQLNDFMAAHGTKDLADIGGDGYQERMALFEWYPDVYDYGINGFDICKETTKRPYETVICCNTMEHIYDPVLAANNIIKALKPGGWLFCSTVFSYDFHPYGEVKDMYRYTTTALSYLFRELKEEKCWFEPEPLSPQGMRVTYIGQKHDQT